jgi:uncharacterized membrane protein
LEGFSDAVFGFALTLLVVSLEVPSSFEALKTQMQGFLGFALMFAMVCWIWYEHNWFFRHTGLQDAWTAFLNSVLLFVVLFYVYPLKFLTAALMAAWFGLGGPEAAGLASGNELLMLYSAGVVMIFGTFLLLYRHARSHIKDLSPADAVDMRFAASAHATSALLGLASVTIAAVGYVTNTEAVAGIAGAVYFLMGPLHAWDGRLCARAKGRLLAA